MLRSHRLDQLDESDAAAIGNVKEALQNEKLSQSLAFVVANYSFLTATITRLEASGVLLTDALTLLADAEQRINAVPGDTAATVRAKLANVLQKNVGLQQARAMGKVLAHDEHMSEAEKQFIANMQPLEIALYRFAPLCSV